MEQPAEHAAVPQPEAPGPPPSNPRIERALALALGIASGVMGLRPIVDSDVFFHLFLGRAVVAAGSRTVPEPAAFSDFSDPCVVPEWLWAVLTYAVHSATGFAGLVALGVLGAVGCFASLLWLARRVAPRHDLAALFVAGLAMVVAQDRMTVRPELTILVWMPLHLWLGREVAEAQGRARVRAAGAIVLGALVWAQLHGSIVLAPVTFLLQNLPDPRRPDRERLRLSGLVLLALLAATCTTAYGLGIVGFIVSHGFSNAAVHVSEMAPTSWASFHPGESPTVLGYLVLAGLGLGGMLVSRAPRVRELLLLLLGAALVHRGQRFVTEAAILAVPLAASGAADLVDHLALARSDRAQPSAAVAFVALVLLAGWQVHVTDIRYAFAEGGLDPSAFPVSEARFLAGTPEGANVYTDYTGSAILGFYAHGRYRVYVDGRTPLYFDGVDFGMLRDQMLDADALRRGLARYGAVAAVVHRDRAACAVLAEHWETAFVGPSYTVFRPGVPGRSHVALAPCGIRLLAPDACADGARLESSARTIEGLGDAPFASLVRAAAVLECGPDPGAASATIEAFEPRSRALGARYQRLRVRGLFAAGRDDQALALVSEAITDGDPGIVHVLEDPVASRVSLDDAERLLREEASYLDDQTPPPVRAVIANLCAQRGDEDCAREHAMRAAALGLPTPALDWLAEHHSSARVRNDAARWRDVLAAERAAAPAGPAPGGAP